MRCFGALQTLITWEKGTAAEKEAQRGPKLSGGSSGLGAGRPKPEPSPFHYVAIGLGKATVFPLRFRRGDEG